jgi:hypothetical protein
MCRKLKSEGLKAGESAGHDNSRRLIHVSGKMLLKNSEVVRRKCGIPP